MTLESMKWSFKCLSALVTFIGWQPNYEQPCLSSGSVLISSLHNQKGCTIRSVVSSWLFQMAPHRLAFGLKLYYGYMDLWYMWYGISTKLCGGKKSQHLKVMLFGSLSFYPLTVIENPLKGIFK